MERYAEYKDSGVEWIGDIPSHWALRRGSTIGDYSKGSGITKGEVVEEGFPCVRYGELYTQFDHALHEPVSFIESPGQVLASRGAIFITASGETVEEIGKCVVYLGDGEISVGGDIIVLDAAKDYDSEYLSYLINSEGVRCQRAAAGRGGIIVHIYSKNFRQMDFVHPPVEEQRRIVAFLDERTGWIDEAVKNTEKKSALLKEQRTSLINEVVTNGLNPQVEMRDSGVEWIGDIPNHWSLSRLASLTSGLESGVSANSIDKVVSEEGQLAILKTSCVSRGVFEIDQHKVVLKEEHNRLKCPVQAGSIIVSRMNTPALVGASAYVDQDASYLFLPDRLWQVYIDVVGVVPKLLGYVVGSVGFRRLLSSISVGSSPSMKNIPQEAFLKSIVPVGPVEEQERIVAFLDERTGMMDEVIAMEKERITLLKQYRQSLISEVVTGKRKVFDEPYL